MRYYKLIIFVVETTLIIVAAYLNKDTGTADWCKSIADLWPRQRVVSSDCTHFINFF